MFRGCSSACPPYTEKFGCHVVHELGTVYGRRAPPKAVYGTGQPYVEDFSSWPLWTPIRKIVRMILFDIQITNLKLGDLKSFDSKILKFKI